MLIPIDASHIQTQLTNDCQQLRTMRAWILDRRAVYNANLTTANMTAAGIVAGDQTAITQLVTDIDHIATFLNGNLPSSAPSLVADIAAIMGVV